MSQMRTAPCHRRRVAEKSEQIEHSEFNPRDSKNQPTILWRELFRATSDHRTESALAKYGVTDPEATLICGLARVSPLIHLFEPSDNGDPAVILPIFNGFELVDLIAFDPRQPEVVWCRVGGEPLLGINWLSDVRYWG